MLGSSVRESKINNKSTEMYKNYILRLVSAVCTMDGALRGLVRKTGRMMAQRSGQITNIKVHPLATHINMNLIRTIYCLIYYLGNVGNLVDRQPDSGVGWSCGHGLGSGRAWP